MSAEIAELKLLLQHQQQLSDHQFIKGSLFIDAAVSSANNLQTLISKESYRNKITSLNNPASGELGINLEYEIQNSLRPLLEKTRKTDVKKFQQVIKSLLETGKNTTSLFPAGNIFTSILSVVGNVSINEKGIQKNDIDTFTRSIEKYFNQYEKLYQCNVNFKNQMQALKSKMQILQEDIKIQLQDIILSIYRNIKREQILKPSSEELLLKYLDRQPMSEQLEKNKGATIFPADAVKGCKEIANSIKRVYEEYAVIYSNNFQEISNIISNTAKVSASVDKSKTDKTLKEIEQLYTESKSIDEDNLRLKTLFDRLEMLQQ